MKDEHLIIVGRGQTRQRLCELTRRIKRPVTWSFNMTYPDTKVSLLFEIHSSRSRHDNYEQFEWCPWVVSPFETDDYLNRHPRMMRYPIDLVNSAVGPLFFESTFDYVLAYALMQHVTGVKRWSEIHLAGIDMNGREWAWYRSGACYWVGYARGIGITVDVPEGSGIGRIYSKKYPHIYGQTMDASSPHAARLGLAPYDRLPKSPSPLRP